MSTTQPFFTLLRNAHIIAPDELGIQDILIAGNKIAAIGKDLNLPQNYDCNEIDLEGQTILPGFIDSHVHLIGGGGEGGYATRTPEIVLSKVTTSGVTTLVGCLGTDGTTRHMESLLAKARGLEEEGLSTYIYTGSYEIPTPTITGSVRKDIIIIDKIIGTGEIAMADHRSAQPTKREYQKLAAEARVGGMLSGKAGIVDMHMGDGTDGMKLLYEITANGELPKSQFLPTHVNRNPQLLEESIDWAKQGGIMDITSGVSPASGASKSIKPSKAVKQALEAGVPLTQITMSSDGNGSVPLFDEKGNTIGVGVASQTSMLEEVRDMVQNEGIKLSDAIQIVTSNVARALKLYPDKGSICQGAAADLIVIDTAFHLTNVWCKGKHMVENGQPIVFGTFEAHTK
ncbi:beta-aspartyl-peptidase [Anaerosinus massiliensis]|uniref:beta-aspartyl-peptidase n=1 Tax=Massilibacillus massiliensis TaxID=1806837 RepID=UPI000A9F75E9|nr:beta-aspartyl-peptidase [Massilibacillus massiliensis]